MTRRPAPSLVILALAFALAACAPAGQSATTSVAPHSAPPSSAATIELTLKEYSITPKGITAHAGQPVTIVASNSGTMPHALSITGNGVALSTKDLAFAPGASETITATLSPGTYTFFCPVDGHRQLGMEGTLTVLP